MARHPVLILSLFLIVGGCSTPKQTMNQYYLLQLPEQAEEASPDTTFQMDALCLINPVAVHPAFAERRIAIRDHSHRVEYFDTHQWAVKPADFFFEMVLDFISHQHLFKQVATRYWQTKPDYTLETNILTMEVENMGSIFKVHLKVEFILRATGSNQIVVDHRIKREASLKQKDLNEMAATLSQMFYEELLNFTQQIKGEPAPAIPDTKSN